MLSRCQDLIPFCLSSYGLMRTGVASIILAAVRNAAVNACEQFSAGQMFYFLLGR